MIQAEKSAEAAEMASSYAVIAREVFAPLYPYYAERILERTGVRAGRCLDVGCGCGHLGLALAEAADLTLCSLDQSPAMLAETQRNARERALAERVETVHSCVESMPLPGGAFALVVSRGSIPFWTDLTAAFREIWRVLAPGGHAYLGGGLGSPEIREAIQKTMQQRDAGWRKDTQRNIPQRTVEEYRQALAEAGITDYSVERGEEGTWIRFRKPL